MYLITTKAYELIILLEITQLTDLFYIYDVYPAASFMLNSRL